MVPFIKQSLIFILVLSVFTVVTLAQKKVTPKITFIELGSVRCIPCQKMQPIMKSIEEKYGNQIKVIFYDVWKQEERHYAEQYKIKVIPTQVFLDSKGNEIMRHEGFFPEEEIDKFLLSKGLKIKKSERKTK
ncbi:MAG: Thioredoxin [Ignavibacteriae bacterium]|nr:MAG: Thioredoxin [Ignavibacteriota bacterium]